MCTNSTLLKTTLEPPTINIMDSATWRAASNLHSQHTKLKGTYNVILSAHSTKYDAVILSGFPPPAVTNTVV
jgi:hypothetical protein